MNDKPRIRKRDDLAPMERAISDTLDEWLIREHGIFSTWANPEDFIYWLKERGYEIVPKDE